MGMPLLVVSSVSCTSLCLGLHWRDQRKEGKGENNNNENMKGTKRTTKDYTGRK